MTTKQTLMIEDDNKTVSPTGNETLWGLYKFGGYQLPHYANVGVEAPATANVGQRPTQMIDWDDMYGDIPIYHSPSEFRNCISARAEMYEHFLALSKR